MQRAAFTRFLRHVETDLDWRALDAIRATVAEHRSNKLKYLDARIWLRRMWREAEGLGLVGVPPRRILDLGSGPGHFPYVCRYLEHDALALDRPDVALHASLREWMRVPFVAHEIAARVPLPALGEPFDVVTAFRVSFNAKRGPDRGALFDLDDWTFFLDDVRDRVLTPGGRLVLKMTRFEEFTGPKFGDRPLMELFAARGGRADEDGRYVRFEPLR